MNADPRSCARQWVAAALGVILLPALFYGLFWNRYFGINLDGWFQVYGEEILRGKVPYRDFYLFTNPLHALSSAAITWLFGTQWWIIRAVAVLQRLALAGVTFYWLKRAGYSAAAVTAGTVLAIIVFGCDIADPLFYYHQDSVFYSVLAGFCASLGVTVASKRFGMAWLLLAGMLASLAFLTKQTTGLGASLAVFAMAALVAWRTSGIRSAVLASLSVAAGWLILPVATITWLARESALYAYLDQVFLRGPSSKGPVLQVLARPILTTLQIRYLLVCAACACLTLLSVRFFSRAVKDEPKGARQMSVYLPLGLLLGAILAGLALGIAVPHGAPQSVEPLLGRVGLPWGVFSYRILPTVSIYATFVASFMVFFVYGWRIFRSEQWTPRDSVRLMLSAISLSNCYFLSLSWPAFEPMVFPGLAFAVAHSLTVSREYRSSRSVWASRIEYLAISAVVMSAVAFKINVPYGWESMVEPPVVRPSQESVLPQLQGMRLSPQTVQRIERVVALIEEHSSTGEEIFVFPHMPIFYLLAGRPPCTFSHVQFWDVCPDFIASADAERLLSHRPRVLVVGIMPEADIAEREQYFRSGRRSGQRDILEAIDKLTRSGDYELLDTVHGVNCMDVQIWSRKKVW